MILGRLARTGKACPNRADGGLPHEKTRTLRSRKRAILRAEEFCNWLC